MICFKPVQTLHTKHKHTELHCEMKQMETRTLKLCSLESIRANFHRNNERDEIHVEERGNKIGWNSSSLLRTQGFRLKIDRTLPQLGNGFCASFHTQRAFPIATRIPHPTFVACYLDDSEFGVGA